MGGIHISRKSLEHMMIQIYSLFQWFKRTTLPRKERFHSIRSCTKKYLKFSLHYFKSNIHFSKEIMLPSVYSSVKIYTGDVTLWCRKHIFILSWGNFSQLWYLIKNITILIQMDQYQYFLWRFLLDWAL